MLDGEMNSQGSEGLPVLLDALCRGVGLDCSAKQGSPSVCKHSPMVA